MRFLHISDLHLGKSIHGLSLIEKGDQPAWVEEFLKLVEEIKPQAVLIAGDVYDRSSPSAEAVRLLDHLLTEIARKEIPVLMVAGNHDSGDKLSFVHRILADHNLHIAGILDQKLSSVTLEDEYGPVTFWLMPYLFPALVAQKLGDDSIRDYNTAVRRLLEVQKINPQERNVLIAHQNVTAFGQEVERGGSESMVGGVGQIDFQAFDLFDYVALGHIHSSYPVGRENVRYAGSPLCYHFEETKQKAKGPLLIEMGAKGEDIKISLQQIKALHPMRELKGDYASIRQQVEDDPRKGEYLRIVLTDQKVSPQSAEYLRTLLAGRDSVLMELVSEYQEYHTPTGGVSAKEVEEKSAEDLFEDFFKARSDQAELGEKERELLHFAGNEMRNSLAKGKTEVDDSVVDRLYEFLMGQEEEA